MSTIPNFGAAPPPAMSQGAPAQDPAGGMGAMSPQAKAAIIQAMMMGGGGGGMGGPQNSFAGGLASGINPMLQAMMRQKMMGQLAGAPAGTPSASAGLPNPGAVPMGGIPQGNIG